MDVDLLIRSMLYIGHMKKAVLGVFFCTIWISVSEFLRNSVLLHDNWLNHYHQLGLTFPEAPVNGAIWGVWSLCYALVIFFIARKYKMLQTFILSWFIGFVLMWLVVGNLSVLPYDTLPFAIPLSLLESFVATWIIHRVSIPSSN